VDIANFDCDCGNPACGAYVHIRRGYVHIRHPDGSVEERWDHLYVDAHDYDKETKKSQWVETMLPAEGAREIMWSMVFAYMPVVCSVVNLFYRARMYWWRLKFRTADVLKKTFKSSSEDPPQ